MRKVSTRIGIAAMLLALLLAPALVGAELSTALDAQLGESKHVYISSTRKDGTLGKPAEIWFLYHKGAVYVGTPPTSWRVRRIKAGRAAAKIWVGKLDGPSFTATGRMVNDPELQEEMFRTYAKKYPDRWPQYEEKFRTGFNSGSRVMVKYTPD